ncbi:MAG: FixH family protein [Amaricoccus sp.]|nr:FixH family protein [Amaricoccus sp.]
MTGRHVLAVALAAFGVIIGVNVLLAWFAVETFSGVVVDNSYVSSQTFDHDRRAQEALGWTLTLDHADGALTVEIADAAGHVVRPASLSVVVGRPTTVRDDLALDLVETPRGWTAAAPLADGVWTVRIDAVAANGAAYHRREPLFLAPAR